MNEPLYKGKPISELCEHELKEARRAILTQIDIVDHATLTLILDLFVSLSNGEVYQGA